jgi:hypothetical protein
MDDLDRALADAQERYDARIRAEVEEKLRTQEAVAWFNRWASQVGLPTLTALADRLVAAGHKALVTPIFADTVDVVTDLTLTFEQQNGPGACEITFRRGNEQSVAVFFAVNGTRGTGGRVEPPDAPTIDRCAQSYLVQALEGPSW